jgi:PLP dependent protein
MHNIEKNLIQIKSQIAEAAMAAGRSSDAITLLAVSKTKPVSDILAAYQAGQIDFGENYLQEAELKIQTLADKGIQWHYIGPIQSNKTRKISELFDWVHSVDRYKIAERLSQQRPRTLKPLNILLQVNIDNETSKSGISADQVLPLAEQIAQLPQLKLRGLMAIPSVQNDYQQQCIPFARMQTLLQKLHKQHPECDTLSMGMSGDMQAAIAQGSTLVRIGTAIFGKRNTQVNV